MSKALLITGVSGFLGNALYRIAQNQWQVKGIYHQNPIKAADANAQPLDLTDEKAVTMWFQQNHVDGVIHCAALSQPNRCEKEPEVSYQVNVTASILLAKLCREYRIPLVFTSTDQVFDGQAAPYDETSIPNPLNIYGSHKWIAEQSIQDIYPDATICRLPLLYGFSSSNGTCFIQEFLSRLQKGQSLALFIDEYRTPAYVDDVAMGLLLALKHPGIVLHLGGPERLNRYEFGLKMIKIFGFDADLLNPCSQADVIMAAARPADVSSNSQRAIALGYRPRGIEDGLKAIRDWEASSVSE